MKIASIKSALVVLMLFAMTLFIFEDAFARGGRGGAGRMGGSSRGSRSRGRNREKDVKRDRERDQREDRDAFKRAAGEDAD